jgi:hypothetical protein
LTRKGFQRKDSPKFVFGTVIGNLKILASAENTKSARDFPPSQQAYGGAGNAYSSGYGNIRYNRPQSPFANHANLGYNRSSAFYNRYGSDTRPAYNSGYRSDSCGQSQSSFAGRSGYASCSVHQLRSYRFQSAVQYV